MNILYTEENYQKIRHFKIPFYTRLRSDGVIWSHTILPVLFHLNPTLETILPKKHEQIVQNKIWRGESSYLAFQFRYNDSFGKIHSKIPATYIHMNGYVQEV